MLARLYGRPLGVVPFQDEVTSIPAIRIEYGHRCVSSYRNCDCVADSSGYKPRTLNKPEVRVRSCRCCTVHRGPWHCTWSAEYRKYEQVFVVGIKEYHRAAFERGKTVLFSWLMLVVGDQPAAIRVARRPNRKIVDSPHG